VGCFAIVVISFVNVLILSFKLDKLMILIVALDDCTR